MPHIGAFGAWGRTAASPDSDSSDIRIRTHVNPTVGASPSPQTAVPPAGLATRNGPGGAKATTAVLPSGLATPLATPQVQPLPTIAKPIVLPPGQASYIIANHDITPINSPSASRFDNDGARGPLHPGLAERMVVGKATAIRPASTLPLPSEVATPLATPQVEPLPTVTSPARYTPTTTPTPVPTALPEGVAPSVAPYMAPFVSPTPPYGERFSPRFTEPLPQVFAFPQSASATIAQPQPQPLPAPRVEPSVQPRPLPEPVVAPQAQAQPQPEPQG